MKYIIIGTPKAINKISKDLNKLPEHVKEYRLEATSDVYINMMGEDGWTEEECDDVVYIMEDKDFGLGYAPKIL